MYIFSLIGSAAFLVIILILIVEAETSEKSSGLLGLVMATVGITTAIMFFFVQRWAWRQGINALNATLLLVGVVGGIILGLVLRPMIRLLERITGDH